VCVCVCGVCVVCVCVRARVCVCVRARVCVCVPDLKMIRCSDLKYFNTNVPDPLTGAKKFVPLLTMKEYGGVYV